MASRNYCKGTVKDRFYAKVNFLDPDRCWIWEGTLDGLGRGIISTGKPYHRLERVHRLAYEWAFGPIPVTSQVSQKCEKRLCVNPDHLQIVSPSNKRKMKRHKDPVKTRFSRNILEAAPDKCWEWKGRKDKQGYGWFSYSHNEPRRAHRIA